MDCGGFVLGSIGLLYVDLCGPVEVQSVSRSSCRRWAVIRGPRKPAQGLRCQGPMQVEVTRQTVPPFGQGGVPGRPVILPSGPSRKARATAGPQRLG
jgi:hypothetical protein